MQLDSERFRSTPRTCGCFRGIVSLRCCQEARGGGDFKCNLSDPPRTFERAEILRKCVLGRDRFLEGDEDEK